MRRSCFGLLVVFLAVLLFVPVVSSYDSELLGVDDLLFVVSQLGLENFDVRADYSGDGVVDIFDLVLVASHIGYPRSDARRWVLDDSDYPYPELTLVQPSGVLGVNVSVVCPSIARYCQVRRLSPSPHRIPIGTSSLSASVLDTEVVSGVEYFYEARYYVDGQELPRDEVTQDSILVFDVDSPPGTIPPSDPAPVPTVSLTASPTSITSGQSSTLSWSSTNAVSCSASGAWSGSRAVSGALSVTPSTTSTYTLSCVNADGVSDSASSTITVSSTPPPGGVAPLYAEDFSQYANPTAYLDSIPHRGWASGESRMELVNDGPPGTSGYSLRFNFRDQSGEEGSGRDGKCAGPRIGYDYDIRPLAPIEERQEIWDEYWIKYSESWTTAPPPEWGCTGNPDHKLVFGLIFGTTARFSLLNGNSVTAWAGSTPGPNTWRLRVQGANEYWNDEWFQVRRHMKISSAPDAYDGRYRVWIDGELIADSGPVINVPASQIWGVSLGRNRNHGAATEMSVSFGDFKVWNEDPGWD